MRSERRDDGGMVTAELAAGLPVLVVVLAVALTAVVVVSAHIRCADAAREAARAAARGDVAEGRRLAEQVAPGGVVTVQRGASEVTSVVRLTVHPLGGLLPAIEVSERAVAAAEPSAGPSR